jgi:hypothetical protein
MARAEAIESTPLNPPLVRGERRPALLPDSREMCRAVSPPSGGIRGAGTLDGSPRSSGDAMPTTSSPGPLFETKLSLNIIFQYIMHIVFWPGWPARRGMPPRGPARVREIARSGRAARLLDTPRRPPYFQAGSIRSPPGACRRSRCHAPLVPRSPGGRLRVRTWPVPSPRTVRVQPRHDFAL